MLKLLALAAAGYAAWRWSNQSREQAQDRHAATAVKPTQVGTWEGEGGALPVSGAQLGPDPSLR